jgi:hypothetical protein
VRNTDQYPIKLNEMIDACERASKEFTDSLGPDSPIGDIHGMALHEAATRLKRLQFAAQAALPKKQRTYIRAF